MYLQCHDHGTEAIVAHDANGTLDLTIDGRSARLTPLARSDDWTLDAPQLFIVACHVPQSHWAEFEAWYTHEHGPMLLRETTWRGYSLLRSCSPSSIDPSHVVIHSLERPDALISPHRRLSRTTPWFRRLARYEWFDTAFERHHLTHPELTCDA